jgi:hypothetical protein
VQGGKSYESLGNKQQLNEEGMRKKYLKAPYWKKKKPSDVNDWHI